MKHTPEEIKNRLSNIGEAIGNIALDYITDLEKENERLKSDLELWESGGCRATNLFECGVVKELKQQIDKLLDFVVERTEEYVDLSGNRNYTERAFKDGAEFGYNKAKEEHEGKCKTAYIKGIRTMANALKDYDRTDGAWTDYFEHTVEEVLKRLLQENE